MQALKEFMFDSVYTNPMRQGGGGQGPGHAADALFEYYQKHPDELPDDFQAIRPEEGRGPGGLRLHRRHDRPLSP